MPAGAIGAGVLGFSCIVLVAVLHWKKKLPKIKCWLACVASVCLTGGLIATLHEVLRKAGGATGSVFGVHANVVLCTIGLALFGAFVIEADPRKGKGGIKNYTMGLGVAAPILIGAATAGVLPGWLASLRTSLGELAEPLAVFFGATG
ncbi:hypothetical protein [Actinosynnema mirum]|uniref:Uncharacterized protein n=1 Tax=Actinosynnema mirum (strain ATCC 29888 / DSM 43827 / JCM 3225 / NBRC 14064 / NCIMB 13271 / NRRL B-12336 / IMRU 3971 / 101) TaxID=446462 RepID=C6WBC1_ACTMD|nr:hypothetical protein [Actinosynnema mirum]ACU39412.1 hypothetical protein Amir_5594 [Actinosynnema mirum DSM 43827]